MRAVAVLVVATPCPLLLAAPVAIMSGLSRAARIGVVVKGGAALEALAAGEVVLFDKTGTLTHGRPGLADVVTAAGLDADDVLRLAASLDQVSPHVAGERPRRRGPQRGLDLELPDGRPRGARLRPRGPGRRHRASGSARRLDRRRRRPGVAAAGAPPRRARRLASRSSSPSTASRPAPSSSRTRCGPTRPACSAALREAASARTVLVTGDRADIAETVGRIVGVDAVLADRDPADKLDAVRAESAARRTIMVGDGVNDAPALAAAGVGVALAARGRQPRRRPRTSC